MNADALTHAARVIGQGGVVAYPTEFCYGLGCNPRHHLVVGRLLRLKRRPADNGMIIIGATIGQVLPYFSDCDPELISRAAATWPGPYTWLLPANPCVPRWVRGQHDCVAVRVTAHAGAAALCRRARRAIVSTSANRHGRPPARSAAAVRRQFGMKVDYILEGVLGGRAQPSEIRDGLTNHVIRPG